MPLPPPPAVRGEIWGAPQLLGLEGSPTFCTPVFSTPKKNDVEVWRLIDDFRDPNERLQKWRVRYERLSHLAATGARRGDWAISMDFKSGYHVLRCGPARFLAFRCRVRYSWLMELCGDDASKAANALRAEGQVPPEVGADNGRKHSRMHSRMHSRKHRGREKHRADLALETAREFGGSAIAMRS